MPVSEPTSVKATPDERRRARRVGFVTQVESKAKGVRALGWSQDVSDGGLMVATGETFATGTEVVVRFYLPPYPPGVNIETCGVVAWVRVAESMGIRFIQLGDKQREAIAKYTHLHGRITRHDPL